MYHIEDCVFIRLCDLLTEILSGGIRYCQIAAIPHVLNNFGILSGLNDTTALLTIETLADEGLANG